MNTEKSKEYESRLREMLTDLEDQAEKTREERAPVTVDGRMGRVSRGAAFADDATRYAFTASLPDFQHFSFRQMACPCRTLSCRPDAQKR